MSDKINRQHEEAIVKIIAAKKVYTFKDIFVYYKKCSRSTAYEHNLDKSDNIRDALDQNKRIGVASLLEKWISSDNATLQIAAMRLIADEDERRKLNQQYMESEHKGEIKIIREIVNGKS